MKRPRTKRRTGLAPDAERLVWLASGMAESGSRAEDRFWEQHLTETIDQLLDDGDEDTIGTALDQLYATQITAYDELADFVESRAENGGRKFADKDVLLVAAPLLCWSRYRIPTAVLNDAVLANIRVHLLAHVLADNVRLSIANVLFSPDQLPVGYCNTARFAEEMGASASADEDFIVDPDSLSETSQFLSDTRYLLLAISAPRGSALFRWQEHGGDREQALAQWRNQGGACLTPLLPGCAMEFVLPDAYFAASRRADRDSRAYAVRASVAFLGTTLDTPAGRLRAIVAPFCDTRLEEYRISFAVQGNEQVVHGVVWPLLGAEDENSEVLHQIETTLRECGVTDIVSLDHQFPMEYCDDCGIPLYPSADSEVVHPEMPDEVEDPMPRHLH